MILSLVNFCGGFWWVLWWFGFGGFFNFFFFFIYLIDGSLKTIGCHILGLEEGRTCFNEILTHTKSVAEGCCLEGQCGQKSSAFSELI